MRSTFQRRVARLELAELQKGMSSSGHLTQDSFLKRVQARMRLKRGTFEEAAQALVVDLRDDQLEALLAEAEASTTNASVPCDAEPQTQD